MNNTNNPNPAALPTLSKGEKKADITDRIARSIIQEEANARAVLTAKLRAARLKREKAEAKAKDAADPLPLKKVSGRRQPPSSIAR